MLKFFRNNNPLGVLLYLVYLPLFRAVYFYLPPSVSLNAKYSEPLSNALFSWLHSLPFVFSFTSLMAGTLLVLVQAIFVNHLLNDYKFLSTKNNIGGFIYLIICSSHPDFLYLSPALISLTFALLIVDRIFTLLREEKALSEIFDIGFLSALSALFYFPSVSFLIFGLIGLGVVRTFSGREWTIVFTGFFCPFFAAFVYYYWFDKAGELFFDCINLSNRHFLHFADFGGGHLSSLLLLVVLFLFSFSGLPSVLFSSVMQVRKYVSVLTLLTFVWVTAFFLQTNYQFNHLVVFALPLSILFSLVLLQFKKEFIAETITGIVILVIFLGQYLLLFLK